MKKKINNNNANMKEIIHNVIYVKLDVPVDLSLENILIVKHVKKDKRNNLYLSKYYNFIYMADLLTKVSKVLKDNLVLELKANNDFYRNYLSKKVDSPLYGYKIKITQHAYMNGNIFQETDAILVSIKKYTATVLYKNNDNDILVGSFHVKHIKITDSRAEDLFNM